MTDNNSETLAKETPKFSVQQVVDFMKSKKGIYLMITLVLVGAIVYYMYFRKSEKKEEETKSPKAEDNDVREDMYDQGPMMNEPVFVLDKDGKPLQIPPGYDIINPDEFRQQILNEQNYINQVQHQQNEGGDVPQIVHPNQNQNQENGQQQLETFDYENFREDDNLKSQNLSVEEMQNIRDQLNQIQKQQVPQATNQ